MNSGYRSKKMPSRKYPNDLQSACSFFPYPIALNVFHEHTQ